MKIKFVAVLAVIALFLGSVVYATEDGIMFRDRLFKWVNPFPGNIELPSGLYHKTFVSSSMQKEVGYAIYLPPNYSVESEERFPVIYYLHGGRPGNEARSVRLTNIIYDAMLEGTVPPAIYVYVNGGILSHYNYAPYESMGENLFIKELIPHIDSNYRTIAGREGRAIQGFSQGGRGTTRIMFKYPELFSSGAPGGAGYAVEKLIFENDGVEFDTRREDAIRFDFGKGNDAFSLAKAYSESSGPKLKIAIWIGTAGMNYESTLAYMEYLDNLRIPYETFIVPNVAHNPFALYEGIGIDLMNFHANAFESPSN